MDVLNKFYSTVSSTVSQLSGVLPGNPVTREYEVTNHIASAGPGLLWKVYSGYKKSTKQPASVFVCEKKQIVPQDKEIVFETLRRGVAQLTKLRHPQILVVQHPLEESRDCLAFATEPVFLSLANILGQHYNMPANCEHVSLYKLYDVEIKYGILQIAEGLAFLHRDAKILHGNLCPSSVVVNQQGAWKIFGFDFAAQSTSTGATPSWQYVDYRKHGNEFAHPDLDYLAPECGLTESHGSPSDMYSLGVLIFTIYNGGETLFNIKNWRMYTTAMSKLKALQVNRLQNIPVELRDLVRMMLNTTPELRPDEHEFLKASYFEDVGVKALNYLDSLFQWDNRQKSHFYKGLPQIIDKLPHRVCLFRVIPCLVKEYVNPMMVPFVLPNVFAIAESCSRQEFNTHIFPSLRTVMAMNEPIQILLTFMQRMDLLLKMAHNDDIKSDVLPLLYRALESDAQDIQELCLSVLPTFANLIDSPSMKNALLPRIKRLCISTSSISVRVNCLVCIGKLVDHLDKWLVLDEVLPFLPQIPSKEPAVLMGILGIYKLVLTHKKMNMSKELMASKVVPFLMPLSIENSLTLNQFNTLITVIKDMVNRVEVEQRVKLEQLQSIQQEHKSLETSLVASNLGVPTKSMPTTSDLEELFGMSSPKLPDTPEKSSQSLETLTLQDKKRIMAEGDAARRLSSSQVLTPSAATSTKVNSQIKDLTASLLGSGGSGFSLGDGKIRTLPETRTQMGGNIAKLDGPASSLMPVNGSIGSSSMMAGIKPMTNNTMISGSPMMSGNPMMSGMSTGSVLPGNTMMTNSPLVGSNMVKGNTTQGWSGQSGNDWSSSPQWGKTQPVAQLNGNGVAPGWGTWAKPTLQPPLLGNSTPSQPSAKPLSKSEINDLLS